MKISAFFFLSTLFLFSCNNKQSGPVDATTEGKKDSAAKVKSENPVVTGATNSYSPVDISQMDMSYYPVDYPKLKMTNAITTSPLARVIYSRPHLQGRKLFHDVLKYGEPWRLGANEATELELYTDATIQDKKIKAGRYILYCIPQQEKWTIVLNSNIDSWGLQPDQSKDIAHFIVPVIKTGNSLEFFTMIFQKSNGEAELLMAWDNVEAKLPISF
jgi:hypothetical protein